MSEIFEKRYRGVGCNYFWEHTILIIWAKPILIQFVRQRWWAQTCTRTFFIQSAAVSSSHSCIWTKNWATINTLNTLERKTCFLFTARLWYWWYRFWRRYKSRILTKSRILAKSWILSFWSRWDSLVAFWCLLVYLLCLATYQDY